MDTITLKEMIDTMDKGEIFSIAWRTYDHRKQEGGMYSELPQAVKYGTSPGEATANNTTSSPGLRKDPNHYANSTRNLKSLEDGSIKKVHLRLIILFNSKVVM